MSLHAVVAFVIRHLVLLYCLLAGLGLLAAALVRGV